MNTIKIKNEVASSMKQAAQQWEISIGTLKAAKAAGCPAFISSRVYRDQLIKWLQNNPDAELKGESLSALAELKRQKTEAEVTLLRYKIAREERVTITCDEAKAEWSRGAAILQEEAKSLMPKDHYRIFVERCKTRIKGS